MNENWRDILDDEMEELFIALSDETRRKIVKILDGGKEMNVTDIAKKIPELSRSNVSHHLGILKRAGVLKVRKAGKENYYYLNKDHFVETLKKYVGDLEKRCC